MDVRLDHRQIIKNELSSRGWFSEPGAYVLVDGQFGSTGKGAVAALLGAQYGGDVSVVTTNAGPNSGHTGFYEERSVDFEALRHVSELEKFPGWRKVMTQQIPVFAVVAHKYRFPRKPIAYLNAGAVINPRILKKEAETYGINAVSLWTHPNAAVIDYDAETDGAESTSRIASTNKGVGRALARKVMREDNVIGSRRQDVGYFASIGGHTWDWKRDTVFVETAQGFSLGINQQFYPYSTSRECTVGQALSDANIPSGRLRRVIMTVRTFPIRVGSTKEGNSGGHYSDQRETSWEELGLEPELTTVTKRVRRVFTWSDQQFFDACTINQPDVIFVGFMDYLKATDQRALAARIRNLYREATGTSLSLLLGGHGPLPRDVRIEE